MKALALALLCVACARGAGAQAGGENMLTVIGTVRACQVRDTSKMKGVRRPKTYLTIAVEKTDPPGVPVGATVQLIGDGERPVPVGARVAATTHFDAAHPPIPGAGLPLYEIKTL
jgi:hypothetical protein